MLPANAQTYLAVCVVPILLLPVVIKSALTLAAAIRPALVLSSRRAPGRL